MTHQQCFEEALRRWGLEEDEILKTREEMRRASPANTPFLDQEAEDPEGRIAKILEQWTTWENNPAEFAKAKTKATEFLKQTMERQ